MYSRLVIVLAVVVTGAETFANGRDWKQDLERDLAATYETSEVSALDGNRVTRQGGTFVIRHAGILASPARYIGAVNTKVRNGRIEQPGGIAAFFSDRKTTELEVGAAVYLTDIEVRDRSVVVELVSRDFQALIDKGTTEQMRYKGQLEFHFARGYLETAGVADLERLFAEYFAAAP